MREPIEGTVSKVLFLLVQEIMESGNLKQALSEIKSILNTPMKPHAPPQLSGLNILSGTPPLSPSVNEVDPITEGDLPGQLVRVLGKGELPSQLKFCNFY